MTLPATYFRATTYRLADDGEAWETYKVETGTTRQDAAKAATIYLPLGYGGHGRSERVLEAIRNGQTVATPLGTYRIEVEELPNPAAETYRREAYEAAVASPIVWGAPGWGIRRQLDVTPNGSATRLFWVEMGRSLYGPFDTLEAARAELIAEANATTPEAVADELADEPRQTGHPENPGDVELVTGFTAFAGGIVTRGDGVVVTFYSPNLQPLFGWVVEVSDDRERATVEDVTFGPVAFDVSAAKTVALIGRRK